MFLRFRGVGHMLLKDERVFMHAVLKVTFSYFLAVLESKSDLKLPTALKISQF